MHKENGDRNHKRTRVLEAAARVFSEKGYRLTRMADIAVQADIGKSTIYEYFPGKTELFFAVLEWLKETYARSGKEDFLNSEAEKGLRTFLGELCQSFEKMEKHYNLLMEFWAAAASSELKSRIKEIFTDVYREYRENMAAIIERGVKSGEFRTGLDPRSMAAGLLGAIDGIYLQAWFDPGMAPRVTAETYLNGLLTGLLARPQGE